MDNSESGSTGPNRLARCRFDAVLFDFYGTIASGDRQAVERTCAQVVQSLGLAISPRRFAIRWGELFFATVDRCNQGTFRTLRECETISLREALQEQGVSIPEHGRNHLVDVDSLITPLEAYWRDPPLHEDALACLRQLRIPTACVSNADTEPLLNAIAKHGLDFDVVVSSEQARCYKPSPAIFQQAIDALGVDPSRTVHVGDSLHSDVGGAMALGLTAVWVCRDDRIQGIVSKQPDYTISTLSDFSLLLA